MCGYALLEEGRGGGGGRGGGVARGEGGCEGGLKGEGEGEGVQVEGTTCNAYPDPAKK